MIGAGEGNIRQSRSMSANQLPSLWSFFCIWDGSFSPRTPADFRPDGLFSAFGTEVFLPLLLLTSVPMDCFLCLGRKFRALQLIMLTSRVQFLRSHSIKNELAKPAHFLWSRCTESLLWTAVFATVSTSTIRIPPIIAIFPPKACIALMVFITQSFSQIMLDTVFFYSCVSFIQKYVFPADELKIVLDCFWQAALFKRCVPTPYIYS